MRLLFLLTLFISGSLNAQNPISFTYLKPGGIPALYATPDTVTVTTIGTSSFFSSKVTLKQTTSIKPYKAPVVIPPPTNKPPTVSLGADKEITLTEGQTTANILLTPTVTDEDISTLTYLWTGGVTTPTLTASYTVGSYAISVIVTDKQGLTATDAVSIKVNPAPVTPPPTTGERKGLIFESTFESVTNWQAESLPVQKGAAWSNLQHCCSYSIAQAPLARTGNKAIQYTLKKGDPLVSGSSRSEIQSGGTGTSESGTKFERWYGVSFYVTAKDDGLDQSVIQWHQSQSNGIPPMALWISGNQWKIVNTNTGCPGASPGCSPAGNRYTTLGNVEVGKWTDVVLHIKWSNQSDGLIEVWIDGVKKPNITGINGYIGGYYMKMGIYKWDWQGKPADGTSRIIYADDLRIGNETSDYDSVKP